VVLHAARLAAARPPADKLGRTVALVPLVDGVLEQLALPRLARVG
jgi:hypothetical protein